MPKVHVVDDYKGEILKYQSENEIEVFKVLEVKHYPVSNCDNDEFSIGLLLENGEEIRSDDNYNVFLGSGTVVYCPVYDVEKPENEDYSLYEKEDILGYVNRGYYMF